MQKAPLSVRADLFQPTREDTGDRTGGCIGAVVTLARRLRQVCLYVVSCKGHDGGGREGWGGGGGGVRDISLCWGTVQFVWTQVLIATPKTSWLPAVR